MDLFEFQVTDSLEKEENMTLEENQLFLYNSEKMQWFSRNH